MKNNLIKDIGLEFWGLLTFEISIHSLYKLLSKYQLGVSLSTFKQWVIFPEWIPPDDLQIISRFFHALRMENDNELVTIEDDQSNFNTTEHQEILEIIKFKYGSSYLNPNYLHYLYKLPQKAKEELLINLNKYGYLKTDELIKYVKIFGIKN